MPEPESNEVKKIKRPLTQVRIFLIKVDCLLFLLTDGGVIAFPTTDISDC